MAPKKKGSKTGDEVETKDAEKEEKKEEEKKEEEKAEDKAEEVTEEKKADVDGKDAEKEAEKPKEPEKPKELEEDSPEDSRAKLKDTTVQFNLTDSTVNVMPTANGNLLMALQEGGFKHLLAGTRANVGVKAGRYMFEAKIIESHQVAEPHGDKSDQRVPKNLLRMGFSTAGSSLFLVDGPDSVSFDSEGFYVHDRKRTKVGVRLSKRSVAAVLLNLDDKSPNANTVSLFVNGKRVSQPLALPECLKGKVLYPTITYKNLTVQVNFGPLALTPLPFTCRMIQDAAAADVEVPKIKVPKDGKYQVVFPVGLPDKGLFDWADDFLAQNPDYVELSDRAVVDWAHKSGVWKPKGYAHKGNNDSPDMNFNLQDMDDKSIQSTLNAVAPTLKRNFLIMTLKSNFMPTVRKQVLSRFPHFKKVAKVMIGEPSKAYKGLVQKLILKTKTDKAEAEKKRKAADAERKKALEEKKKKIEEQKKARLAAAKKKDGEEKAEEKTEEKKEGEDEKKEEDVKMEEPEAPIELTEEEKQMWCRKAIPDMPQTTLAKAFASFALPAKDEGFDDITYEWQPVAKCEAELKAWMSERKLLTRVEDLVPGSWFKEESSKWLKELAAWRKLQTEWKDPMKKKALLSKKKAAMKKAAEEAAGEDKKEGEAVKEPTIPEVKADDLDVFTVEDVTDIGSGEPLFANFLFEDWELLKLRYEIFLLVLAFKKDLDDPERPSFHESHLAFYYNKYWKKQFVVKNYGVDSVKDFVEFIRDTAKLNDTAMMALELEAETPFPQFVKLTEEHRRERQRRVDAGDETAKLKFQKPAPPKKEEYSGGGGHSRPAPSRSYGDSGGNRPVGGYSSGQKRPYQHQQQSSYHQNKRPYHGGGGGGKGYSGGYRR